MERLLFPSCICGLFVIDPYREAIARVAAEGFLFATSGCTLYVLIDAHRAIQTTEKNRIQELCVFASAFGPCGKNSVKNFVCLRT